MKTKHAILLLLLLAGLQPLHAQFSSSSDGSDGALDFTGLSGTMTFDPATNVPPLDVDGDNIFHFTTITIPAGLTVKMRAPELNWAPVYWLASGAVEISGTLDLSGGTGHDAVSPGERRPSIPGPGGYPGGVSRDLGNALKTPGLGPGGGREAGSFSGWSASHATTGTPGTSGATRAPIYGSLFLVPLIGGSGGGGGEVRNSNPGPGGGAGGGAILIASSVSLQLNGSILSRGGNRGVAGGQGRGGLGSGGAVRLLAPLFSGSGTINVNGINNNNSTDRGGNGRYRIEAVQHTFSGSLNGVGRSVTLAENTPVLPAAGFPSIRIASVNGELIAPSPTGSFVPSDATINTTNPVPVVVDAQHIPPGTEITLTIYNETEPAIVVQTPALSGTLESSTTTVNIAFPSGFTRGWASASW